MKKLNPLSILACGIILFAACQRPCPEDSSSEVEELKVKLNATEAQLLNVSTELVKCKGDSLAIDSLLREVEISN